jgi:hypothetical protein
MNIITPHKKVRAAVDAFSALSAGASRPTHTEATSSISSTGTSAAGERTHVSTSAARAMAVTPPNTNCRASGVAWRYDFTTELTLREAPLDTLLRSATLITSIELKSNIEAGSYVAS